MQLDELRRQGSMVDREKKKSSQRSARSNSRTRSEGIAITRTTSGIKSTRNTRSKSQTRSRGRSLTRSGSNLAGKSLTRARSSSRVNDTKSRASSKVKSSTSTGVARREPSVGARTTGRARSRSITRTASSYSSNASSGISSSSSRARSQFMSQDGVLTKSLAAAASSSSDLKCRKKKNRSSILSRSKSIRLQKANPNVNSFVSTTEISSKSSDKKKEENKTTKEMGRSIVKLKKGKERSIKHLSEIVCEEGNSVSLMSDWSSSVQSKKSKSVLKKKEDGSTMSNSQGIGKQVSEDKSVKSKDSTDTKSVWSFMSKKSAASAESMPKLSLVPPESSLETNTMPVIKSQESTDTKSVFSFMSRKSNSSQEKEPQSIPIKSQESSDTKSVFSFMSRKSNFSQEKNELNSDENMDVEDNSQSFVGGIKSKESNDTKSSAWSFMNKKSEKLISDYSQIAPSTEVDTENNRTSDSKHVGHEKHDDASTLSSISNVSYFSKKSATTSKSARSEKTLKTDNKNRLGKKVSDKTLIMVDSNTSKPKLKKSFFRKKKSMPTVEEETVEGNEENEENEYKEDDSEVLYRAVLYLGEKADGLLTKGVNQAGANLTQIRDSAQCVS